MAANYNNLRDTHENTYCIRGKEVTIFRFPPEAISTELIYKTLCFREHKVCENVTQDEFTASLEVRMSYLSTVELYNSTGCLQPCDYVTYETRITESSSDVSGYSNETVARALYFFFPNSEIEHLTKYEPFDLLSLVGEIGGFMGLFLGFSIYDVFTRLVEIVQRKRKDH